MKDQIQFRQKYCNANLVSRHQRARLISHYLIYPGLDNKENQINSDEDKENQDCNETITCWYCRKSFEKGQIYDDHYSYCYNRYAYMHM